MDNYINSSIINIINHYCDSLNDDKIEKILWNKLSDKEKVSFAEYAYLFQEKNKYFFNEMEYINYKARYINNDSIKNNCDLGIAISENLYNNIEKFIKHTPKRYSFYYKGNIDEDIRNLKTLISLVDFDKFSNILMDNHYLGACEKKSVNSANLSFL